MSDLGNMAETITDTEQPVETVAVETEEVIQPQGDDGEVELYVEAEGDQSEPNKTNMSQEQAYAAFRKEKEKRQRKNEELEASKKREQELASRLAELEGTVGKIAKGAPPTLESYDYDEAKYQEAVRAYYSQPQTAATPTETETQQQQQSAGFLDDESEFYLYQKEQDLMKHFPSYESDKTELVKKLNQYGGGQQSIAEMAHIAHQTDVDIARAVLALNRNPMLVDQLVKAYPRGPFAVEKVLKQAESKIQTRQRKPLDSEPEPTINNSGPIDKKSAAVAKAREAWMNAEPHEQPRRWQEYQAAKKS